MKTMKYRPGTFLEVEDLKGGRKVVLVGKDGVTFWDSVKTDRVTPLVIHPVLRPLELGTAVSYAQDRGLSAAACKLCGMLRERNDERQNDSLYVMRVLWNLAPRSLGKDWTPDDETLQAACAQAEEQERVALRVHEYAEKYVQRAVAA